MKLMEITIIIREEAGYSVGESDLEQMANRLHGLDWENLVRSQIKPELREAISIEVHD